MRLFAKQYLFEGPTDDENEDSDVIYLEFPIKDLLMGFKFFNKDTDAAKVKLTKDNFPLLRINTEMDGEIDVSPKYRTEIPVLIVPKEKWTSFPVPTKLEFNTVMKSPRFAILKKYVDIYKNFKFIHFTFRDDALQVVTDDAIGSRVSTTFEKTVYLDDKEDRGPKPKADVIVDARKLALYFSSLPALNNVKIANLSIAISHQKMMKIFFQNEPKSISFHYVIASKAFDEEDESEEEYDSNEEQNDEDDL